MTRNRRTVRHVKGKPTGQALVNVLRDSPLRNVTLKRKRMRNRVRPVKL